jgi:hypothetical protein
VIGHDHDDDEEDEEEDDNEIANPNGIGDVS